MTVDEAWAAYRRTHPGCCSDDVNSFAFRAGWEAARPKWRPMSEAPRGAVVLWRTNGLRGVESYVVGAAWQFESFGDEWQRAEWTEIPK